MLINVAYLGAQLHAGMCLVDREKAREDRWKEIMTVRRERMGKARWRGLWWRVVDEVIRPVVIAKL